MADKFDFKKEYKDLYLPGKKPVAVQLPAMPFLMVDGRGAPGGAVYQNAMGALYSITFTIKMSKLGPQQPEGYFDYVLPPLEGLWDSDDGRPADDRESWGWTSMLRLPDYVAPAVFEWALAAAQKKKPEVDFSGVRMQRWEEGLCVQALHVGPFSAEAETLALLHRYMDAEGYVPDYEGGRRHHEIYLGDPRKTSPEKCRTVLRLPVKKNI